MIKSDDWNFYVADAALGCTAGTVAKVEQILVRDERLFVAELGDWGIFVFSLLSLLLIFHHACGACPGMI